MTMAGRRIRRTTNALVLFGSLGWLTGVIACAHPGKPPVPSRRSARLHELGFPMHEPPWSVPDFQAAAAALETSAKDQPPLLPMLSDPDTAADFERLVSPVHLKRAMRDLHPPDAANYIRLTTDPLQRISHLYGAHLDDDPKTDLEMAQLLAVSLHSVARMNELVRSLEQSGAMSDGMVRSDAGLMVFQGQVGQMLYATSALITARRQLRPESRLVLVQAMKEEGPLLLRSTDEGNRNAALDLLERARTTEQDASVRSALEELLVELRATQ
jgi:hypothetical protein